tara:strand:- start:160 stop:1152 length:993 start_codon:yes stop_codon:yes gene_type:complete
MNQLGLVEVLPHIPKTLQRIKTLAQAIKALEPHCVITIDLQGFNKRLAKKLQQRHYPLVHYVAPTVWAWRPKRAKKIAKLFDMLLTLFPFEPHYFEKEGLQTHFVGHPLFAQKQEEAPQDAFDREMDETTITLLPGSRSKEVENLMPIFIEAINRLEKSLSKKVKVLIPTLPEVREKVEKLMHNANFSAELVTNPETRWNVYRKSHLALAASGTVALELASALCPMVIAYKVSPITAWIAKRLVKTKWACLVNIIVKKEVVPEFIQENCTAKNIALALMNLLLVKDARTRQIMAFRDVSTLLKGRNDYPAENAAEVVLKLLEKYKKKPAL